MARQLALATHCLLCLASLNIETRTELGTFQWKTLYERQDPGFNAVTKICKQCLQYIRGGNWPTDVYAKLSVDRKVEGERATEALLTS